MYINNKQLPYLELSQFASQFVREGDRGSVGRNDGIVVQPAAEEELVCGHVDGWHANKTRPVTNPVVPIWFLGAQTSAPVPCEEPARSQTLSRQSTGPWRTHRLISAATEPSSAAQEEA